ncbi:MAG: sensor histidine kinase [Ramlibacter sp.]
MSSIELDAGLAPLPPPRNSAVPGWRAIAVSVLVAAWTAAALGPFTHNSYLELLGETLFVGISLLFAFTAAGAWQQELMPRWAAQLVALGIAATLAPLVMQLLTAGGNFAAFASSKPHVRGYVLVTVGAAVIGMLLALGALLRERDAQAHAQALRVELLQERLERLAADARLNLMTAQIQPHFLLNTLANVQALVESGSPRAGPVFRSLIAYLRAAAPLLQQERATLGDEERLVAAYLDLMQMRMPDRLRFIVQVDPTLRSLPFPPMALLTLVENAIHHGVDPAVDGGHVEVTAERVQGDQVAITVADDGVGMDETAREGTGLTNLRQRLAAFYPQGAQLALSDNDPRGLRADINIRAVH